jgi:hypothetical protein
MLLSGKEDGELGDEFFDLVEDRELPDNLASAYIRGEISENPLRSLSAKAAQAKAILQHQMSAPKQTSAPSHSTASCFTTLGLRTADALPLAPGRHTTFVNRDS